MSIVGKSQSGRACAEPASRPSAPRSGGGAKRRALTSVSTRARCWLDDAAGDHNILRSTRVQFLSVPRARQHREVSRVVLRCIGRRATPRSRRWKLRRAAPPRRSRRSQPALSRGGPIHAARSNGIRTPNQAEQGADRSPGRRLHGPLEAVQRRQGVVDGRLQVGHRLREGPAGPRKEEKRKRGNGPEKCRFSRNTGRCFCCGSPAARLFPPLPGSST